MNKKRQMGKQKIENAVLDLVSRSKSGLTPDSVMACMALEEDIKINIAFLQLLLEGRLTAKFIGPEINGDMANLDLYTFKATDNTKKIKT